MQEQNPIVLMNFSGIYREEEFWNLLQILPAVKFNLEDTLVPFFRDLDPPARLLG